MVVQQESKKTGEENMGTSMFNKNTKRCEREGETGGESMEG